MPFAEAVDQRNLLVYPNPATGEDITVKLGAGWFQPTLRIYDMNGRPVRAVSPQATTGGQVRISVGDLAPGLYIVTAQEGAQMESTQVIVH